MKLGSSILAAVAVCWLLIGGTQIFADIYTWTDQNGIRHYSNSPPSDAEDPQVLFKEYEHDPNVDQRRIDMDQEQWKTLIEQIEADERESLEAAERRANAASKNQQPTLAERAAAEEKRLEKLIADLEEKPLEYFGSYDNKRMRLIYHQNRLETLKSDPEKYFNDPQPFRGVVKPQEK